MRLAWRRSSGRSSRPGPELPLEVHDLLHLVEEPGVDAGHAVDLGVGPAEVEGPLHVEDAVGVGVEQLLLDPRVVEVGAGEAADAGLQAAQALLQGLLEGAADGHDLPHRLHLGAQGGLASGNFSKAQRGIFTTT